MRGVSVGEKGEGQGERGEGKGTMMIKRRIGKNVEERKRTKRTRIRKRRGSWKERRTRRRKTTGETTGHEERGVARIVYCRRKK